MLSDFTSRKILYHWNY